MPASFWRAMAAYAVLAALAWPLLADMRFRLAVWALLAGLAVKTWIDVERKRRGD